MHDRLVVAHTTAPIVAEARDAVGPRFIPRRDAPVAMLRRPASAAPTTSASTPNLLGSAGAPPLVRALAPRSLSPANDAPQPPGRRGVGSDGRYYKTVLLAES